MRFKKYYRLSVLLLALCLLGGLLPMTAQAAIQAPATPTGLNYLPSTSSAQWGAVDGAAGYEVQLYSVAADSTATKYGSVFALTDNYFYPANYVSVTGKYCFEVRAFVNDTDKKLYGGWSAKSANFDITVTTDTTAPTIEGGTARRQSDSYAIVTFGFVESSGKVSYTYAVVDDGAAAPDLSSAANWTASGALDQRLDLYDLTAGAKDFYLLAKDEAGNKSAVAKIDIPDYVAPAWTLTGPNNASVYVSENAVFNVGVSGEVPENLVYQWQEKANGTWNNISGATGASYSIAAVGQEHDGRQYRCIVTDSLNYNSVVTSGVASLTVKTKSSDAGVKSVSVSGTQGTVNGTTITVALPYTTAALPTSDDDVTVTPADHATATTPVTNNNGATWTFTVTAEDDSTVKNYTIEVSIAPDPATENKEALNTAETALKAYNWTVNQKLSETENCNNKAEIEAWLKTELAKIEELKDITYILVMEDTDVTSAVAGTAAAKNGTDGGFSFSVKLSKAGATDASYAEKTVKISSGVIKATVYIAQPVITAPTTNQLLDIFVGDSAKLEVTAENALTYQWYLDKGDGNGYEIISGANSASYETANLTIADDGNKYYCLVSGETGSTDAVSVTFELNVEEEKEFRVVQNALNTVPDEFKSVFSSLDGLKEALSSVAQSDGYDNFTYYDLTAQMRLGEAGDWIDAPSNDIPSAGLTVVLPYPQGVDYTNYMIYEPVLYHLAPGATTPDNVPLYPTESGLSLTVSGFSPFVLAWKTHDHSYGSDWETDHFYHWHECSCGAENDVSEHKLSSWKIVQYPTASAAGKTERKCSVCGYIQYGELTNLYPPTGDNNEPWLWAALMAVSATSIAGFMLWRRRSKKQSSR